MTAVTVVVVLGAAAPAQAALVTLQYDVTVTDRCEGNAPTPVQCAPVAPADTFLLALTYDDAAAVPQLTAVASSITVDAATFTGVPYPGTLPPDPGGSNDVVDVIDILTGGTVTRTVTAQTSDFTFVFDPVFRSATVTTRLLRSDTQPALAPLTADDLRAALSIGTFDFFWEATFAEGESVDRLLRYEGTATPALAAVPEPSATMLGITAVWLTCRRRRARQ